VPEVERNAAWHRQSGAKGKPTMRITRYQAIGFSCYGTLVDREGGILEALRPLVAQAGLSTHPDWLLGSYHRLARELRQAMPNASQTSLHLRIHQRLAQELQQEADLDASVAFGNATSCWPVFEDAPGALQYLSKFYRLVLLASPDDGDAAAVTARLPEVFAAVIPNRGGDLRLALDNTLEELGLARGDLLPVRGSEPDDPWNPLVDFPLCTLRRDRSRPWNLSRQALDGTRCEYASLADLVHAHQTALRA